MSHVTKNYIILLMAVFALFSSIGFAADFDVSITPSQYSVYPGDIINFNTEIKNNLNSTQEFSVAITNVNHPNWVTIKDYRFSIEPNETKKFIFYISPDKDAQKETCAFDFDLSYTIDDEKRTIHRKVNFFVMQEGLLELELNMEKSRLIQGEDANIVVIVRNKGIADFKNALVVIELKEKDKKIEEKIPLLKIGEERRFEKTFEFDDVEQMDEFIVSAKLYKTYLSGAKSNLLESRQITGEIAKKSKVQTSYFESRENYIVKGEYKASNKGNAVGESLFSLDILYPMSFYEFSRAPDAIITNNTNNIKTAIWNCPSIDPGKSCSVSYSVDLKSLFYIKIFGTFFLILYVFYIVSHQIYLKKKILKVSDTKTSISIELKNNSGKVLDKCEIIEFVPASLKVDGKFDALPPDEIKRSKKGTHLKWIFKPFMRGEERIIVYSVTPILKTFGGITVAPTKAIGYKKRKMYIKKSKSLNVC